MWEKMLKRKWGLWELKCKGFGGGCGGAIAVLVGAAARGVRCPARLRGHLGERGRGVLERSRFQLLCGFPLLYASW